MWESRWAAWIYRMAKDIDGYKLADIRCILSAFNIVSRVSIPKGSVKIAFNTRNYTQYTSYISLNNQNYYFKTDKDNKIVKVSLDDDIGADHIY